MPCSPRNTFTEFQPTKINLAFDQRKPVAKRTFRVTVQGPEWDVGTVNLPSTIKISSKLEDNSIEAVRRRLRTNLIDHTKFEPQTQGKIGHKYYSGVYEPNNPAHVAENKACAGEPKNYFAFIAKHRPGKFREVPKVHKKH